MSIYDVGVQQHAPLSVPSLVIATRNSHKVFEIRSILGEGFRYLTLDDLQNPPVVVEDADTFAGNATKKAVELARWLGRESVATYRASRLFVLADDSGLEVDALNGAPGVHSARFAALDMGTGGSPAGSATNSSDADNNVKLLRLLKDVPLEKRAARFCCTIALVEFHPPSSVLDPRVFDGTCEGCIGFAPRGANGFGYDPLFTPDGYDRTFAELGEDVKNKLSHRARALAAMKSALGSIGLQ